MTPNRSGPLRSIHVIAGLDRADGGPSYVVPRLCQELAEAGHDTSLFSIAGRDGPPGAAAVAPHFTQSSFAADCAGVPVVRGMRLSSALDRALAGSAPSSDIIHNHGLWLMPNVKAGWSAHSAKVPFVLSPHGMLSATALSFSRMKKQAFWKLMQRSVVARAACLHATSEAEHQDIRDMGLVNPVAIIPIGVDVPPPALRPESAQRTVMSLGRVHPKKGLDRLISAWAEVEASNPSWRLRIIGPSEQGHDDELRALATTLGLTRMSIEGPLYGPETLNAYRSADLFVLPTRNENFGMTVAEALAAGTPAISTTGAPWAGLETEGCGWWIDQGVEPLAATLREAMAMPREALLAKGEKGRRWVTREFSWARTASDLFDVYRWLASAASPPPSVRFV